MAEHGPGSAKAGKFSDLGTRLMSAVVVATAALACIWIGGLAIVVLAALAVGATIYELRSIVAHAGARPDASTAPFILAGIAGVLLEWLQGGGLGLALLSLLAVLAVGISGGQSAERRNWTSAAMAAVPAVLFLWGVWTGSWQIWLAGAMALIAAVYIAYVRAGRTAQAVGLLGTIYIGTAGIAFVALRDVEPYGFLSILWAALVVVAADVGGYFAGRMIGGAKLWPAVSPKKTWAGLGGGVVLAFLVGGVFSWSTNGTYFHEVCTVSAIAAVLSQGGDLAESALKRHFGVKDSGTLIPGHGGVLDRLDGHMAALLVVAGVTLWRGQAVFVW